MANDTDVQEFITDLDGGVFAQKLAHAVSQVAGGVIDHEKNGEITIKLKLKKIGTHQVAVEHKLSFTKPTNKGNTSEVNTTSTPMYVGKGGKLTLFPENQTQMFSKSGEVNPTTQQG